MKKTTELPVAESVKLCIELDNEMQEWWKVAKEEIEEAFEDEAKIYIPLTDSEIFKGILNSWDSEDPTILKAIWYVLSFSEEEIEAMKEERCKI